MNIINKVTLQTLKKNRVRTIVTILGIILSTSMLVAVTSFISSFRNYLIESSIEKNGNWHSMAYDVPFDVIQEMSGDKELETVNGFQNLGFVTLEEGVNPYKPYLFIAGFDEELFKMLPVSLIEGRLPENINEIVIPAHLKTNGGIEYKIGDTLTFQVGKRVLNGQNLGQQNPYRTENEEQLVVFDTRSYLVVGVIARASFEEFSAPGYTAITLKDSETEGDMLYTTYFRTKNISDIYNLMQEEFTGYTYKYNTSLLTYLGVSHFDNFYRVLYSLAAILIVLIMYSSISLIYNAFSISVNERTKQFGILSSIGATKKQLRRSVFFEALFVSMIGIPIGILSGILGIGITLFFLRDRFTSILPNSNTVLTLSVSSTAVIVAIIISLLTVFLSAYIPARRASKRTAMDAIRQSNDIKMRNMNIRASKITYRIFGLEGLLAKKHFKRNRRRYRTTVVSLFMSIVLFISASSFTAYLTLSLGAREQKDYDIEFFIHRTSEKGNIDEKELYNELRSLKGITDSAFIRSQWGTGAIYPQFLHEKFLNDYYNQTTEEGFIECGVAIFIINDERYEKYLESLKLSKDVYMNIEDPKVLVAAQISGFDFEAQRFINYKVFTQNISTLDVKLVSDYGLDSRDEDFQVSYDEYTLNIGKIVEELPIGFSDYINNGINIVLPNRLAEVVFQTPELYFKDARMVFNTVNHKKTHEEIVSILNENTIPQYVLINIAEFMEADRNMLLIMKVLSFGFITLISLIAVANVFNTISTNIHLRRRELAMLKSVGMTKRGFMKMMNYECLLYGIKSFIYGLPVAFLFTYLIYLSVLQGLDVEFFIPWNSVVIAMCSVFLVVSITMVYSMNKLRKENTIDVLKNENY